MKIDFDREKEKRTQRNIRTMHTQSKAKVEINFLAKDFHLDSVFDMRNENFFLDFFRNI